MVTEEELVHNFVAKDVMKNKIVTVARQMFIEYEKEVVNSNQTIKVCDDYIGDNKFKMIYETKFLEIT